MLQQEKGTKLKKLVAFKFIDHWHDDSLYIHVDDIYEFIELYGEIFNTGVHNDLSAGIVDIYGINYYSIDDTLNIIKVIKSEKPKDYLLLLYWLERASNFYGFYLLGI